MCITSPTVSSSSIRVLRSRHTPFLLPVCFVQAYFILSLISQSTSVKMPAADMVGETPELSKKFLTLRNYQLFVKGAMLMAMFLRTLSFRETVDLTKFMTRTGETLKLQRFPKEIMVDKHSTGGVGDKVSLVLAPALAAHGLKVPMVSGRGLGYTGGTLDKIESIPGFQVYLSSHQMNKCLEKAGCFICGPTKSFAPADGILYRVRDLTGTVENSSLIVSSILSKKACEGLGALVLDVKFGTGALFKSEREAEEIGKVFIKVGNMLNLKTQVVVSEMNTPLGYYVGNALEVVEAVMCLRNEVDNCLTDLVKLLGGVILKTNGQVKSIEEGKAKIQNSLENKTALSHFEKMLTLQGVSEKNAQEICAGNYWKALPKAKHVIKLYTPKKGIIVEIDALKIGQACWSLGSGRLKGDTQIDHSCGVVLLRVIGDTVAENEPWIDVHCSVEQIPAEVEELIKASLKVDENATNVSSKIKQKMITSVEDGF